MTRAQAYALRAMIEKAAVSLDDTDAPKAVELFPEWKPDTHYERHEHPVRVRNPYDGLLYQLVPETHDSQADWPPHLVPAIWAKVLIPDPEVIYDWEQPDSTNPYKKGDKVRHKGKIWISDIDGNIWEPGVFGCSEVE